MPTLTQHAPGTFCWPELATTDQAAAKKFYGGLFGWRFNDSPLPPEMGGAYTMFQSKSKDCAALFTLDAKMRQQGVPPHWGAYISVSSADDVAQHAASLGGTVLMQPSDVMGHGRMAVIADPTGAKFSVWQAMRHIGAGILDEPGALCWTELLTHDTDRAGSFYKALIGWGAKDMSMMPGSTYTVFTRSDGTNAGGLMKLPESLKGVPPHWLSYFQVDDVKKTTSQVTSLGGKIQMPPRSVPNVGQFAVYADPQGAVFAVLQPQA